MDRYGPLLTACAADVRDACAALKLSQEQQVWDHARRDWEHWKGRVEDEVEAAQVSWARPACCGAG